ncbi:PREDICTED: uncharacterized protein LOC106817931 isoform X2 [Priapulus caudatus]|uniref:Uncharacterized protein LOC106817931 isoform X2 n=1 Tax=Priapulus caudatus TaxID=37621 RepID=A0ABM1F107_PRICU|nr:PREDICTED: uncharacterized protein LOC106817931 isoform X2 [Priapulus caudatus]
MMREHYRTNHSAEHYDSDDDGSLQELLEQPAQVNVEGRTHGLRQATPSEQQQVTPATPSGPQQTALATPSELHAADRSGHCKSTACSRPLRPLQVNCMQQAAPTTPSELHAAGSPAAQLLHTPREIRRQREIARVKLRQHKVAVMHFTDEDAWEDSDCAYTIFVSRLTVVEDAFRSGTTLSFREKIAWPLVVCFNTEVRVDQGGPQREFLSLVLKTIETIVMSQVAQVDVEKFFVAGIYCAISIVQAEICPPFVLTVQQAASHQWAREFLDGLEALKVNTCDFSPVGTSRRYQEDGHGV